MFQGLFTALITPFKDNKVDFSALEKLLARQIASKVEGVVLLGSTGEGATINFEERAEIIKTAIKFIDKRIKLIVGTATNSTESTIAFTKQAQELEADAALIVAPYYNKPNQLGLLKHYQAVASATSIPIIIYNHPGRTGINITDSTIAELAKLKNFVGLKDSAGDVARVLTLKSHGIKSEFSILAGDDIYAVAFNAHGTQGLISVVSNIVPELCMKIQELCAVGLYKEALAIHQSLVPLYEAMCLEVNPVPIKYSASLMGMCTPEVRLPLVEMQDENKTILKNVLQKLNLL